MTELTEHAERGTSSRVHTSILGSGRVPCALVQVSSENPVPLSVPRDRIIEPVDTFFVHS